ncbi:MAG: hypothetical protein EOP38_09500 [Rubrivivax sp.]|nr:MAG: hypothetical protein EOP38_09500 [Rubrivivax sp.]
MKPVTLSKLALCAWLAVPCVSQASFVTLGPSHWATMADGGGGPIDGQVDFVELNDRIIAGYSSTTPEVFHGLFQFDLSGLILASQKVVLELPVYASASGFMPPEPIAFQLYGFVSNAPLASPQFFAGSFLADFTVLANGMKSVDVASFVHQALADGHRYAGFNIRPHGDPLVNDTSYWFGSPGAGPTSVSLALGDKPPISEPGAVALLLSGLMVGVALARVRSLRQ